MEEGKIQIEDKLRALWDSFAATRSKMGTEMPPMAFIMKEGEDTIDVLPLNEVPYDHWRTALRMLASSWPLVIGTITEAWVIRIESAAAFAAHEAASALGIRNSDREDRVDMFQLTAETPDGTKFNFWAEIKDGKVGEMEATDHEVSGRLTGLYPPLESSGL